ncbi:hypothetical protein KBY31_08285 [Ruegeria pomeroyi]|nr:hypothetical protein [Ruegeria pomeroyi]
MRIDHLIGTMGADDLRGEAVGIRFGGIDDERGKPQGKASKDDKLNRRETILLSKEGLEHLRLFPLRDQDARNLR